LSVDAALPSAAARLHLGYAAELGKLVPIDLKRFGSAHLGWASSVLNSHDKVRRMLDFPADFNFYVTPESALKPSLYDDLAPRLLEVSAMLDIRQGLIDRDGQKLGWLFHSALRFMRSQTRAAQLAHTTPPLPVVGRLAFRPLRDKPEASSYLESFVCGKRRFEDVRVSRATQLRVLWHLSLATVEPPLMDGYGVAGESADTASSGVRPSARMGQFHALGAHEHEQLADALRGLFQRLGAQEYEPEPGEPSRHLEPPRKLDGGELDWFEWVKRREPRSDEEARLRERFLVNALAGLRPDAHQASSVVELTRALVPKRMDDVIVNRLACSRVPSRAF
jgi:hypothetical protein